MSDTIHERSRARVRLLPNCPGDGRQPHHPAEQDVRVLVTAIDGEGDHSVFALYKGGGATVPQPAGGLGLGRYFRPDELEPIPDTP